MERPVIQAWVTDRESVPESQGRTWDEMPGQALAFSLGVIRIAPNSTDSLEELLSQADEAMYKHKVSRRGTTSPQ